MTQAIPLTNPGPLWSQREYVACRALGIGFAAHSAWRGSIYQHFHYHFPEDANRCTTVTVSAIDVVSHTNHRFKPDTLNWIKQCSGAMAKEQS
jgi:hypothetical protein